MRTMIAATRLAAPLAVTALCTLPAAAQGFEGTVTWEMGPKARQMSQTYKGTKVRTEMGGPRGRQGVMIMDASTKTMTMLMPDEKMYMVMSMEDMAGQMEDQGKPKTPKLTDTGKSETIAGKTCQVYRYAEDTGKPETLEMCVAKGMGFFMGGGEGGPMGGMRGRGEGPNLTAIAGNPEWARRYKDGFFPLRISKVAGDKVTPEMVATQVEAKSIDASAFAVPEGFTEMKMPGGMGMPRRP